MMQSKWRKAWPAAGKTLLSISLPPREVMRQELSSEGENYIFPMFQV
jgi:hypothetical protein